MRTSVRIASDKSTAMSQQDKWRHQDSTAAHAFECTGEVSRSCQERAKIQREKLPNVRAEFLKYTSQILATSPPKYSRPNGTTRNAQTPSNFIPKTRQNTARKTFLTSILNSGYSQIFATIPPKYNRPNFE